MAIEVNNDFIEKAIYDLVEDLGLKDAPKGDMFSLVRDNKIEQCANMICFHYGLPVKIKISDIALNRNMNFRSVGITQRKRGDTGTEGIVAQVLIPDNIPLYGTKELEGYPIEIVVNSYYWNYPATLVSILSHELSHVLLESIKHPQRENELYVDIVPLLFGMSDIVYYGRKPLPHSTSYGYLSDSNFVFALAIIKKIKKQRHAEISLLKKRAKKIAKDIKGTAKMKSLFCSYLKYIDENRNIKFNMHDGNKIVIYHSRGYQSKIDSVINSN